MNWHRIFNLLWEVINRQNTEAYFSGPRFMDTVREVEPNLPPYRSYMQLRESVGQSTTRKDYFFDTLMALDEPRRVRAVNAILQQVEQTAPEEVGEIRGLIGDGAPGPVAAVPDEAWQSERLNHMIEQIDACITAENYERAVTLGYTCLEGVYKAFFRAKCPGEQPPDEILELAKWIRDWVRGKEPEYPDEVLNMVRHTTHAVDRARNRFSEAHFAGKAGRWLAVYLRDLVNVQIRLLLNFM